MIYTDEHKALERMVRGYSLPTVLASLVVVMDSMRGAFPDDADYQRECSRRQAILETARKACEGARFITDADIASGVITP
jgi:hypothetical protein